MEESKKGTDYLTNEQLDIESYDYNCGKVIVSEDKTSGTIELLFLYRDHDTIGFKVKKKWRGSHLVIDINLEKYYPPRPYQQICRDIRRALRGLDKKKSTSSKSGGGTRAVKLPAVVRFKFKPRPDAT